MIHSPKHLQQGNTAGLIYEAVSDVDADQLRLTIDAPVTVHQSRPVSPLAVWSDGSVRPLRDNRESLQP